MSEPTRTPSAELGEKLYEARGGVSTGWQILAWGGPIAYLALGGLILRMYYHNAYVLRAPSQEPLLATAILLIGGSVWMFAYFFSYPARLRYLIDTNGLRVVLGAKEKIRIPFGELETARLGHWWEAFTKSGGGEGPQQKVLILLFLTKKLPWTKGGTRFYHISPEKPAQFLEKLLQAWNNWRQAQGAKSSS